MHDSILISFFILLFEEKYVGWYLYKWYSQHNVNSGIVATISVEIRICPFE